MTMVSYSWFLAIISVALCKENLFEGDIVLDKDTQDLIDGKTGSAFDAKTNRKWTNGVIPYVFDSKFDQRRRKVVMEAIAEYNKHTCIRFIPRTNQNNYVHFINGGGCYSYIGMTGGRQDISIGPRCYYKGIVMHEMMHASGFFHEQSRIDRDQYITIHWENILSGVEYNFRKYRHGEADTLGQPYDYDSVMHYGKYAFSKNRRPTIVAKGNPNQQLGQRRGFSEIDIKQLNILYGCTTTGGGTKAPTVTTGLPSNCVDKSKYCGDWAKAGYCTKSYVDYMKKNCCKSCSACFDKNSNCGNWAKAGYCKKSYVDYMKRYCCKSCSAQKN